MEIFTSIQDMKTWSRTIRAGGQTLGLVPTMGYLHEGHLSLARKSQEACNRTVASIFVNPKQFRPNEDLETYPRDPEADCRALEALGVDVVFMPAAEEMYPPGYETYVSVEDITDHLCGKSRPGFFRGVTTIVLKLFHIVQPHKAFFGEKDRQQLEVIRKMVTDLDMDVEIVGLPIVREADGLAMSSRNKYLRQDERQAALSLSRALEQARTWVGQGVLSAETLRTGMRQIIESDSRARVDYISICDPRRFEELEEVRGPAVVALAVQVGKARLIDNCLIERH